MSLSHCKRCFFDKKIKSKCPYCKKYKFELDTLCIKNNRKADLEEESPNEIVSATQTTQVCSTIYRRRNKFLYAIRGNLQSLESIIQHLKSNPLHEQLTCCGKDDRMETVSTTLKENTSKEIEKLKVDIHELEMMLSQLMHRYYTIEQRTNLCECLKETCQVKKFYKKDGECVTTLQKIEENRYEEIIEKEIQSVILEKEKTESSSEESETEAEEEDEGEETEDEEEEKAKQNQNYLKLSSLSSHFSDKLPISRRPSHFGIPNDIQKENAQRAEQISKFLFEDIHNNRIANLYPEMLLKENNQRKSMDHSQSLLRIIKSLTEEIKTKKE